MPDSQISRVVPRDCRSVAIFAQRSRWSSISLKSRDTDFRVRSSRCSSYSYLQGGLRVNKVAQSMRSSRRLSSLSFPQLYNQKIKILIEFEQLHSLSLFMFPQFSHKKIDKVEVVYLGSNFSQFFNSTLKILI